MMLKTIWFVLSDVHNVHLQQQQKQCLQFQSIKYMTVTSCYNFTFITTLSDVHQNVYAGDEEEEYRDDAVNNIDDNLIRAHQLEQC